MQISRKSINRLWAMYRHSGIKYVYNYLHFNFFYAKQNKFITGLTHRLIKYPPYLEIEVTTRCNLKCIMCEHTYWQEKAQDMSFADFKRIIDEFPKLKWIGLTGIGESFMHKDFLKMLEYVKARRIYVELYDTFYFIDENTANKLIDLKIDMIKPSIDAATKQTYEKIRVNSDFNRVMDNIKNLLKLKQKRQSFFPELEFHYILSKANMHELNKYIELVGSLGGESILVTRFLHIFKEIEQLYTEVPDKLICEANKKAQEVGIKLHWSLDVPKHKPPISMCSVWIMPFIFLTGHVIPCCAANEANRRDFQKETSMGNIFEVEHFSEIWNGEKFRNVRKMIKRGLVPKPCIDCCLFNTRKK